MYGCQTDRGANGAARPACMAALAVAMWLLTPQLAAAHVSEWREGDPWWTAWNWDPVILFNLGLLTWLYYRGLFRLWQRAGAGRVVARWQVTAFNGSLLAMVAALISPLDVLGEQLSWVHMVQHMVLMMVAAPLFVLAAPALVCIWGMSGPWRRVLGRWRRRLGTWNPSRYLLWQPFVLWVAYAVTLWIWHWPALYHAALRHTLVHDVQHLMFFIASCFFWRVLLDPLARQRLNRGLGVLYLFTTSLHASALGVFMALSPRVWYADYETRTPAWNLTPLEDQQLAGLIMWMPACTIYAAIAVALFVLWLHDLEKEERVGEPR
jgi:putative membrane protein